MQALEYRPWGTYQVLHDTSEAKVKVIEVEPRSRLSYQYHNKRSEEWTVIQGNLTVVLDDMEYELVYGDSISIPSGSTHRAWNKTDKPVRFVEVQTGTYFGEDDIVRLEDDYERAELEHLKDGNYIGGLTMPVKNTNKLNKDE